MALAVFLEMCSLDVLTFEQSVESSLLRRQGTFLLTRASGAKRKHLCATRVGGGDVFILHDVGGVQALVL